MPVDASHIFIAAGETSGDRLAASLVQALRERNPQLRFCGICGDAMRAQGVESVYSIEEITAIGIEGLVSRLPRILNIRRQLLRQLRLQPPALYIGVDAPDFNLPIEAKLRAAQIPTIQLVAPTVWAWRRYRVSKIRRAVSLLLTIFPFESRLYTAAGIPYVYVGHPLADEIDAIQGAASRAAFGLNTSDTVIALLPGSRVSEVRRLSAVFLSTAQELQRQHGHLKFIVPFASAETQDIFIQIKDRTAPQLNTHSVMQQSRAAIATADLVISASGTAALEAALLEKPVVVGYRVSMLTEFMVKALASVRHYSILNHLGEKPVIPEFMQAQCNAENLSSEALRILDDADYRNAMIKEFADFRRQLKCNAAHRAAAEVLQLLKS